MTDKETEYLNLLAKEVETNGQGTKGSSRIKRLFSNDIGIGSASSKTLTSLRRSNGSSDRAAEEHDDMAITDSSKRRPFQGARLKVIPNSSAAISPPVLTPDSGVSMGSSSHKGQEMNFKLVSSHCK